MSLMNLIKKYDAQQAARVQELEDENARLREQLNEAIGVMMKGEALRDRQMIHTILTIANGEP